MLENRKINDFPLTLTDENGRVYHLEKKIGEGGQGAVFLAQEKGIAIKLMRTNPSGKFEFNNMSDIKERQEAFKKIKNISLDDIEIKYPISILSFPYLGYVMEILDDMIPLKDLMFYEHDVLVPKDEESFKRYIETGGLKKRLKLLGKIAETMSQLHSKGLVFADPSPDNFFISKDIDDDYISLIDADNLEYQSKMSHKIIYTPPYGAPELVKGVSGVNTLTDAHAFAVIAFWMLTGVHPRYGDIVTEGEPEMEEKAQKGDIPWVDDENDNSNFTENGMPRKLVLSSNLQRLFKETFENGVNDYLKRPSLVEWENVLNEALHSLISCECGFHYYANNEICPLCGEKKPQTVLINIKSWLPPKKEIDWEGGLSSFGTSIASIVLTENIKTNIDSYLISGNRLNSENKLSLEYNAQKNEILISNLDRGRYFIASKNMKDKVLIKRKHNFLIPNREDDLMIHFDSEKNYHRVITFVKF